MAKLEVSNPLITYYSTFQACPTQRYISTPYPVHYCSTSLQGVPYTHTDFAPLRIMSSLVSSKFLHTEIREKGGAYGGGSSVSSAGLLSFYSYRDPNCAGTLNAFERSLSWIRNSPENWSNRDLDEAKLGVFKRIDAPTSPGSRGLRQFLSEVSDDMFDEHREQLKAVQAEDVIRVAAEYLDAKRERGVTVIGPERTQESLEADLGGVWTVESLGS